VIIENFRLSDLITNAFNIKDDELFGEPHWADIDRYKISANAPSGTQLSRDIAWPMMRSLLADRFQLKVHMEMRELPVYALVVAKGGPKFKESLPDAEKLLTLGSPGRATVMTVTKGDMAQLAGEFSGRNGVDRPVIDKTGLTGLYDYKLEWGDDVALRTDADVVSIFRAMPEQLGLKLKPTKVPVQGSGGRSRRKAIGKPTDNSAPVFLHLV
jgi:uncharacterized protein (TIGR03435 family)